MEFHSKKEVKPQNRKMKLDVEKKRLTRLYPFLSKDQILCKAKDNLNLKKRDVYEFDADSEGEASFPKKDPSERSKVRYSARYKPLSVFSTKVKKKKVIEVIELSSDSDNEIEKPESVKNEEDFDWKSVKIKTEPDHFVKIVKKAEPKVREETKMARGYGKNKMETNFDKLLLSDTKYVRNSELKVGENSNDMEDWKPFMNRTRSYGRTKINHNTSEKVPGPISIAKVVEELSSAKSQTISDSSNIQLSDTKSVGKEQLKLSEKDAWRPFMSDKRLYARTKINDNRVPEPSSVDKKDKAEFSSEKRKLKFNSNNIQEPSLEFKDKSKILQPGIGHDIWGTTESLNCEKLKIKTSLSESSDNDSVPELMKSNFTKKSNAHKFLKLDPDDIQIKNVGGNRNSKANKYLNPHFYTKKLPRNDSSENPSNTRSTFQLFHRKILNKEIASVATTCATKDTEDRKCGEAKQLPFKLINNKLPEETKVQKNTALTKKLQALREIPEDPNAINKILQSVYKVRESEEERRTMDQKTLRTKRVSFVDTGFLSSLFD